MNLAVGSSLLNVLSVTWLRHTIPAREADEQLVVCSAQIEVFELLHGGNISFKNVCVFSFEARLANTAGSFLVLCAWHWVV